MAKKSPRNISDVAIDCAIHGLPEPKNGWRNLIPAEDLGQMANGGSGQITLQALVAQLHYDGTPSVRTLYNYYDICKHRFMLSEPWSAIYGAAIVNCWAAVVLIAERRRFIELSAMYRELLSAWAATCSLMEVKGKVMAAGCRSWGFDPIDGVFKSTWGIASGRIQPARPGSKRYAVAGIDDDWGWITRNEYLCKDIFKQAASNWLNRTPVWLAKNAPRWNARTEYCLYGWSDGSRFMTMGDDEMELDDEDANSNTPGVLAAGVLGSSTITMPKWPAKDSKGDPITHLRQTGVFADIDGNAETGWILYHSHLGDLQSGGYMITTQQAYKPKELVFAIKIPKDDGSLREWIDLLEKPNAPVKPVILADPATNKPRKQNWLSRLLKKLWPF